MAKNYVGNLCWDTYHNQVKSTKSFVISSTNILDQFFTINIILCFMFLLDFELNCFISIECISILLSCLKA